MYHHHTLQTHTDSPAVSVGEGEGGQVGGRGREGGKKREGSVIEENVTRYIGLKNCT